MRIVHLSDLHLGFRAFPRRERGWNLRERDLAGVFHQSILEIARLRPEVVILSGDIFDRPDPPSSAFLTLTRGLGTLRAHLPGVRVLAIAGARDTPLALADPGPVAVLDALAGVEAAAGAPRAVHIHELGVHALLVPHRAALTPPFPELRPSPDARWNLLVLRGEPSASEPSLRLDPEEWDYVAIGGTHEAREFAPNVRAAGSLERVGWDPWLEATEEKGFLVCDLEAGTVEFHPVPGRPVVDLAPVRVAGDDQEGGSRRLRDLLDGIPGGVEGKIVRVRLRGDVLLPSEGIAAGLWAAVWRRAAHAELQLTGDGDPGGAPAERGTVSAGGRITGVRWGPEPLDRLGLDAGIAAITAQRESSLERLTRALAGEPAGGEEGVPIRSLRLELEGDWSDAERGDLLRGGSPEELLGWGVERLTGSGVGEVERQAGGPPVEASGSPAPEGRAPTFGLNEARADAVEAAGDLEARAMEWARERQDAESHLLAYRDQARELRARLRQLEAEGEGSQCPTCGLPVGDHLPRLVETLKEEWDGVVQDGKWWKRRREQLDEKPLDLQEMEGRAIRLQARVEELSTVRESRSSGQAGVPGPGAPSDGSAVLPALWGSPEARRLLRRTTSILHRLAEGTLTGVFPSSDGIRVEEEGKYLRAPAGGEVAALSWALRVATAELVAEGGGGTPGIVFGEFSTGGAARFVPPALEILRGSRLLEAPVLFVLPSHVPAAGSEWFSAILELREEGEGRSGFRRVPGGIPSLSLGG